MNLINMISDFFSYSFVWYAFIAGILAALCSSLLGVTLVLKRYSFIGDGLSHVAFGAMAIAAVLSVSNNLLIVMPVTIISAILLLKTGQNAKIKGDAALAMISVGSMAFGYLLLNLFSASANISGDVCSTLFGSTSILTLTGSDIILCVSMSIVVILIFVLFYNRIFAVTFDETFAKAVGTNANGYNLLIAALIIFPVLSAMRIFSTFRQVIVCAAVYAVVTSAVGILISIILSTPAGATIVVTDLLAFGICSLIGKIKTC